MKYFISIILVVCFCLISSLFGETIYIKGGKIIRGKIIERDSTFIMVDAGTKWYKVKNIYIEKIKYEDAGIKEETTNPDSIIFNDLRDYSKGIENDYSKGKEEGNKVAKGSGALFGVLAGCCLGPIGYAFTPMYGNPSYEEMLPIKDKSNIYKQGFREGYKNNKTSDYIYHVTIGWVGSAVITTLIILSNN